MKDQFEEYIALLETLKEELDRLAALARKKNEAVCGDDLMALDGIMRQEQAITLQFRGLEQKRGQLLAALGLSTVPLSDLPAHFPLERREAAQRAVDGVKDSYRVYQANSAVARNALESNLREVEHVLDMLGGGSEGVSGPGYAPSEAEPPQTMKTDFRA